MEELSKNNARAQDKLPYHSPTLDDYGAIVTKTQSFGATATSDAFQAGSVDEY